jgi:hypothetical protein
LIVFAHRPNDAQAATFNFRDVLSQNRWSPILIRASPCKSTGEVHGHNLIKNLLQIIS